MKKNKILSWGTWISPKGEIFEIPLTHIKYVIDEPARFDLNINKIKEIYHKHNEGIGSEGNARDEIVNLLISNGWIRIRYYPDELIFNAQLVSLTQENKNYLHKWATKIIKKHPEKIDLPIEIIENTQGCVNYIYILRDFLNKNILLNSIKRMLFEDSVAYWISPKGDVLGVHGSHTSTVIELSKSFGLIKSEAEALFATGEEQHVLKRLIEDNWIRIRFQNGYYFITVNLLSPKYKHFLKAWALGVLKLHPNRKNNVIIIDEFSTNKNYKILLESMSKRNFIHNDTLVIDPLLELDYKEWSIL